MIVDCFADYLAYTFESGDSVFMLGMRLVNKSQGDMISAVDVLHNERVRLLYGIEGYRPLSEAVSTLNNSELAMALIKFIDSIRRIEDSDFLKITAIDINFNRLYYDPKSKSIKFVLLPINYQCDFHDGESWSNSFRKTVIVLLSYIFNNMPEKYNQMYYEVIDESKTDYEVIEYISKYEFGLQKGGNFTDRALNGTDEKTSLVLEHSGVDGNFIFMVNKPEFIMGKSKTADGTITNSAMVSRNHCLITKNGNSFMVEDLGSTNGTSINGYILNPHEIYYLNNGDTLTLADVEFKVLIGQAGA